MGKLLISFSDFLRICLIVVGLSTLAQSQLGGNVAVAGNLKQFVVIAPAIVRPYQRQPYSFVLVLFEGQGYSVPLGFQAELIQTGSGSRDLILAVQNFTANNYDSQMFTFNSHQSPDTSYRSPSFTVRVTLNNPNLVKTPISSSAVAATPEFVGFIQTDKHVYRPGQTVFLTAFMLDRDLKPAMGTGDANSVSRTFTMSVKDSAGNLVGQWKNVSPLKSIWSAQLNLPPMANKGSWSIFMNSTLLHKPVEKRIEVAEYELPRFDVSVTFMDSGNWLFNLTDDSGYNGYIKANYTFGRPIRGQAIWLLVSTGGCNPEYDSLENPTLKEAITLVGDGEEADGFFTAIGLNDIVAPGGSLLNQGVCPLTFLVEVKDKVSATTVKLYAKVVLHRYHYRLDVVEPIESRTLMPGTRFNVDVALTPTTDQVPDVASGLDVMFEMASFAENDFSPCDENFAAKPSYISKTLKTDDLGHVTLARQIVDPQASKIAIKLWMIDRGDRIAEKCFIYDVQMSDAVLISLKRNLPSPDQKLPRIGNSLTFHVSLNFPGTVYFGIAALSTGQILKHVRLQARNFVNSTAGWTTAAVIERLNNVNMPPRAVAFAWAFDQRKEKMLSDVVSFQVDGLVKQTVQLGFADDSTDADSSPNCPSKPKARKYVNVQTNEPRSTVVILAVDKKLRLVPENRRSAVTNDAILRLVDPGFVGKSSELFDEDCWEDCGSGRSWVSYPADGISGIKTPDKVFQSANLMLIVGYRLPQQIAESVRGRSLILSGQPSVPGEQLNALEEDGEIRRKLPEVWFFAVGETDANGKFHVPIRLPDSVTSWSTTAFAIGSQVGFGAMQKPVELLARKELFVDLVLPQRGVKLGESFGAVLAVYNYSPGNLTVTLTLEDISEGKAAFEYTSNAGRMFTRGIPFNRTLLVSGNMGRSAVVYLRPLKLGNMPMRLTAKGVPSNAEDYAMFGDQPDDGQCGMEAGDYNDNSKGFTDVLEIETFNVEAEGEPKYVNKPYFIRISPLNVAGNQITVTQNQLLADRNVDDGEIVSGSHMYEVGMNSDLMGPVLSNFNDLVRMPSGCGEQLMMSMMPNAFVYKYLKDSNQLEANSTLKSQLLDYVINYLPRLMVYETPSSGFSVFEHNKTHSPYNIPETWLTAFIIRYYVFCSLYVDGFPTDRAVIERSFAFLSSKVNADGSVTELYPGSTHPEMQGGAGRGTNLAMYVYATFAEASRLPEMANRQAVRSLIARTATSTNDPYQLALAAYATSWNDADKREISQPAIARLLIRAIRNYVGNADLETMSWSPGDPVIYPSGSKGQPSSVETSAYALLAFLQNGRSEAAAINRWLVGQRNSLGGFRQTQDTVVGLHALSEFAAGMPSLGQVNMNVSATFIFKSGFRWSNAPQALTVINTTNAKVFQRIYPPRRPTDELEQVQIVARGNGYLYIQISMRYNVKVPLGEVLEDRMKKIGPSSYSVEVEEANFESGFDVEPLKKTSTTTMRGLLRNRRGVSVRSTKPARTTRSRTTKTTTPLASINRVMLISGNNYGIDFDFVDDSNVVEVATRPTKRPTPPKRSTAYRRTTTTKPTTTRAQRAAMADLPEEKMALVGLGDDVTMKICLSNTSSESRQGMVTMEVKLPSGFAADLEKTKRLNSMMLSPSNSTARRPSIGIDASRAGRIPRDPRLQNIETSADALVYYFDLSVVVPGGPALEAKCCVVANIYRQSQIFDARMPYVTVYNYYKPAINMQVAYDFSSMSIKDEL